MSSHWQIRLGEKVSKPMSAEDLKEHFKAGRIPSNALLSSDGATWRPLSDFQHGSARISAIGSSAPPLPSSTALPKTAADNTRDEHPLPGSVAPPSRTTPHSVSQTTSADPHTASPTASVNIEAGDELSNVEVESTGSWNSIPFPNRELRKKILVWCAAVVWLVMPFIIVVLTLPSMPSGSDRFDIGTAILSVLLFYGSSALGLLIAGMLLRLGCSICNVKQSPTLSQAIAICAAGVAANFLVFLVLPGIIILFVGLIAAASPVLGYVQCLAISLGVTCAVYSDFLEVSIGRAFLVWLCSQIPILVAVIVFLLLLSS